MTALAVPTAYVVSEAVGRIRLRIPARARDPSFFSAVRAALGRLPGVAAVDANPLTGSILMRYEGRLDEVVSSAEEAELFRVERQAEVSGGIDVRPMVGMTLLGLAALQATRGKFLPAGLPMMFHGLSLLRRAAPGTSAAF